MFFSFEIGMRELPRTTSEQRYASPKHESKFIRVMGSKIHYRDEGSGPALLLVHGVADSLHTWNDWTIKLKPHYRVLRLDLPGFALSENLPVSEYNTNVYSDFIAAFLEKLEVNEPIYMAGNSLGGSVTWNFAADYPKMVRKIALLDPASYPLKRIPWIVETASLPLVPALAKRITPKALVLKTTHELFVNKSLITPDLVQRYYDLLLTKGNRESYFKIFRTLKKYQHDYPDKIKSLQCPVLLMWGEHDSWIPSSQIRLWQRDLPGVQVKLYPQVGHMPQMEVPDISAQDALEFFS